MQRRLASILVMDVVGYSRLMERDEAWTLSTLKQLRHDVIDPSVERNHGRCVKLMGDGSLFEFASIVDAVSCAVEVQSDLAAVSNEAGTCGSLLFRMGIHLGDVIVENDDIYGDAVNVAARLEALAEPGGLCLSQQAYDQIEYRMEGGFRDLGRVQVKNVARAIHAWAWSPKSAATNTSRIKEAHESLEDSIPVLLIEEFSHGGDPEAARDFADEIRTELLATLSRRSGIKVTTASKASAKPTYRLNGRCRVAGERCRLQLTMSLAETGETLWSSKTDGETLDLLNFVDEAVLKVATALRTQINAYGGAAFANTPNEDLTVQQLLSKSAYLFYRISPQNIRASREATKAAVDRAPTNAMALAMQAYALSQGVFFAMESCKDVDVQAALELAERSVLDGASSDFVFMNRGRIKLWLCRDHAACRADAKRSLSINPGYHMALENLALADIFGGQPSPGIHQLETLLSPGGIEPVHTAFRHSILAIAYCLCDESQKALEHAREAYDQNPFIRIHAIAYALAADKEREIVGSPEFEEMLLRHDIRMSDASRFPFAGARDEEKIADKLGHLGLT